MPRQYRADASSGRDRGNVRRARGHARESSTAIDRVTGASRRTDARISEMLSPANAGRPVSISYTRHRTPRCRRACRPACPWLVPGPYRPRCRESSLRSTRAARDGWRIQAARQIGSGRCPGIQCLRQAKVEHLHRAIGPDFDVCGLQIAVNDALFVRRLQGFRDLSARSESRRRSGWARERSVARGPHPRSVPLPGLACGPASAGPSSSP